MRVTAQHRGLRNSGPDHAAGQNQTLGESSAHLRKIKPLDDIDVIDHAQSETDDLFVRHDHSRACGNDNHKRWQRQTQAERNGKTKRGQQQNQARTTAKPSDGKGKPQPRVAYRNRIDFATIRHPPK